jgi:hypothetical protein
MFRDMWSMAWLYAYSCGSCTIYRFLSLDRYCFYFIIYSSFSRKSVSKFSIINDTFTLDIDPFPPTTIPNNTPNNYPKNSRPNTPNPTEEESNDNKKIQILIHLIFL